MNCNVIALTGAKGSGKDSFFHIVQSIPDRYDQPIPKRIAYADPIRQQVNAILGLRSEPEYDDFKRRLHAFILSNREVTISGRQIVREIGMLMRKYDENQFTNYVDEMIRSHSSSNIRWFITDLRFNNELQSLKKHDAVVIKIKRAGVEYDGHVSETEIPDSNCHIIIHNDGDFHNYRVQVQNAMFMVDEGIVNHANQIKL